MHELLHNISVTQPLTPAVATTTQTSSAIDRQGFESTMVIFAVGASGDTLSGSVYWTFTIQESDASGSGYTDVVAADIVGGVASVVIDAAAEDETVVKFNYAGNKRYLKAVATKTGTHTNGTPMGVIALRGKASLMPVS